MSIYLKSNSALLSITNPKEAIEAVADATLTRDAI